MFDVKSGIKFRQQNCTQLYKVTQLEFNFYIGNSKTFAKKAIKSTNTKVVHKMLLKLFLGEEKKMYKSSFLVTLFCHEISTSLIRSCNY